MSRGNSGGYSDAVWGSGPTQMHEEPPVEEVDEQALGAAELSPLLSPGLSEDVLYLDGNQETEGVSWMHGFGQTVGFSLGGAATFGVLQGLFRYPKSRSYVDMNPRRKFNSRFLYTSKRVRATVNGVGIFTMTFLLGDIMLSYFRGEEDLLNPGIMLTGMGYWYGSTRGWQHGVAGAAIGAAVVYTVGRAAEVQYGTSEVKMFGLFPPPHKWFVDPAKRPAGGPVSFGELLTYKRLGHMITYTNEAGDEEFVL